MKVKVWIPYEIDISKTELKKAMKRVRKNWSIGEADPVHMEDVINNLCDAGVVTLPIDDNGAGLKFEHKWQEPFTESEL